ncbi:hypothetical protein GIB67_000959 [Kingdonia uniflora]|uniref:F-box domain-containing protein n=1 Tax=Kingdonia uniflora TaxID=39325 RepID=A0A7J7MFR6_9MAGN|nr:hypothetical protein GIB67_000959 [Kingdonia uniflora]
MPRYGKVYVRRSKRRYGQIYRRRESDNVPPSEIISEILLRLPAKSVGRFKCVCKLWRDFISDPSFPALHFKLTKENNQKLMLSTSDWLLPISFDKYVQNEMCEWDQLVKIKRPVNDKSTEIIGSCDGLILIIFNFNDRVISLWNPTTRDFKIIQKAYILKYPRYGFGYDESTNDYKVVSFQFYTGADCRVCVYSLRNNSWRTFERDIPFVHQLPGILVNGNLHWIIRDREYFDLGKTLLCFDLKDEEFRVVSLPEVKFDRSSLKVDALGGLLCFHWCCGSNTHVWQMKEYGVKKSWTKLFSTKEFPVGNTFYHVKLWHATKDGKILIEVYKGQIYLIDTIHKTAKRCGIRDVDSVIETLYVENLLSFKPRSRWKKQLEGNNKVNMGI